MGYTMGRPVLVHLGDDDSSQDHCRPRILHPIAPCNGTNGPKGLKYNKTKRTEVSEGRKAGQYAYCPAKLGSMHTAQQARQYAYYPGSMHTAWAAGQYAYCPGSMHTARVSILPVTYI